MRDPIQTLWDLLKSSAVPAPVRPAPPAPAVRGRRLQRKRPALAGGEATADVPAASPSMQERYEQITKEMLQLHGIRVRRWRNSMSGIAWQVHYKDGHIAKLIEAPRPRGPMSAAIFLHEIGHHAIGFNVFKPRCLEEYHAWAFALQQMEALGLNVTDAVRRRMHMSLRYAVQKAQRRGLRKLPAELIAYTKPYCGAGTHAARS